MNRHSQSDYSICVSVLVEFNIYREERFGYGFLLQGAKALQTALTYLMDVTLAELLLM